MNYAFWALYTAVILSVDLEPTFLLNILLQSLSPVDGSIKSKVASVSLRQHEAALIGSRIYDVMFEDRSSNAGTNLVLGKFLLMTCQDRVQSKPGSFCNF